MPPDPSDADLLQRWRDGDEHAGSELVRRHFDGLFRFFRSRVDDGVSDLVQQTFLACVEAPGRIPGDAVRLYLFGIARNKLLMHLRNERRRGRIVANAAVPSDVGATMSGQLGHRDEQRLLLRALRKLPVDLQLALVLSYWEGMRMEEIGAVLGVPAGTVKSRLHRARRLLKDELAELGPADETTTVTVRDLARWARELGERAVPQPG